MKVEKGKRIGIIGLDAYHGAEFTKILNNPQNPTEFNGYRVVAAYPQGSKLLEKRIVKIPEYSKIVQDLGVKIVNSIDQLLNEVDEVMLCSNDARVHLEQAMPVIEARKAMFIDKPFAANLQESVKLFDAAERHNSPIFSSSGLRFIESIQNFNPAESGKILGALTFSPADIESYLPDLLWYGIHGIEMLFAIMGAGCRKVQRTYTESSELVTGIWEDERIGTYRGFREGLRGYGGTLFSENGPIPLGDFESYKPLVRAMVDFFETGNPPVSRRETLEIIAFIMTADESRTKGGKVVSMPDTF